MMVDKRATETHQALHIPGSSNSPPGNLFQRLVAYFWYHIICGARISVKDMIKDIYVKPPMIDFEKLKKRSDQVAVMTGGPRGIGFDIVKKLLQLDYTVILGVRNISTSQKGIDKIRSLGITSGRVKFLNLDLKSLNSVRQFAKEVLACEEGSRIDLLLNNAGIVNVNYEMTPDNCESTFQVNYLSHFLLTNLLLPRIKETAANKGGEPCQIVNTSSNGQHAGNIEFNDLETSKVYVPFKSYCNSKLCQVIHVKTLENMFQQEKINAHAYAVHPGEIATDIWDSAGVIARIIIEPIMILGRTTDGAANTILYPVLTPELGGNWGGEYFESGKVKSPNKQVNKPEIQERLWERSLELTKHYSDKQQKQYTVTRTA